MTAAAPHIWTPPKWLVNLFAHLKKASSGHLLKASSGHLLNKCGCSRVSMDATVANVDSTVCSSLCFQTGSTFAGQTYDSLSVNGTYTVPFDSTYTDSDGKTWCRYFLDQETAGAPYASITEYDNGDCTGDTNELTSPNVSIVVDVDEATGTEVGHVQVQIFSGGTITFEFDEIPGGTFGAVGSAVSNQQSCGGTSQFDTDRVADGGTVTVTN